MISGRDRGGAETRLAGIRWCFLNGVGGGEGVGGGVRVRGGVGGGVSPETGLAWEA